MSNSLAIAAVSHLLVEQLKAALPDFMDDKFITVGPPQMMREGRKDPQVNLFLYQLGPDPAWRNQDIPTKPKSAFPLLALKLNYLVTAFGKDDDDTQAHPMLGAVMLRLHSEPILPTKGLAKEIADSNLADQFESVRLTLQPLTLDEATKLWSGFQSPYRLSVAYEASVVLIESDKPARSAPPVLSRGGSEDPGFEASVFGGEPTIQSIKPPFGLQGPRLALGAPDTRWVSDELFLVGQNLDHPDLRLLFSHPRLGSRYIAKVGKVLEQTSTSLRIRLPQGLKIFAEDISTTIDQIESGTAIAATADNWPSGVYTVAAARGVHAKVNGVDTPAIDRLYSTSPFAFGLLPEVKVPLSSPANDLHFSNSGAKLKVSLRSKVRHSGLAVTQSVKLFVGPIELVGSITTTNGQDLAWETVDPGNAAKLAAALKLIPKVGRFLRVQVDGVDSSLLATPQDSNSLPAKQFNDKLLVTVTPP